MHSAYVDLVYMTIHQCRSFVKFLFCQRFSESFIICLNSTDIWDWRYKSLEHISLWHHCTQPKLFILNSCSRDPLLCIFCMSPLFNTPNSDHQLIRRETFFLQKFAIIHWCVHVALNHVWSKKQLTSCFAAGQIFVYHFRTEYGTWTGIWRLNKVNIFSNSVKVHST